MLRTAQEPAMNPRMYTELAPWWPLLSPVDAYADEASLYHALLAQVLERAPDSLLELGCGAGTLASHLPAELEVILNDLSPDMLAVAAGRNPGRQQVPGDLRTLRLERQVDAVLLHDAVMYMLTEADLTAALATARAHLKPGGALLVVPDVAKDGWDGGTDAGGDDAADSLRAARLLEWRWDPDPNDSTFQVEMAMLLRDEDGVVRCIHEQHTMGIFSHQTWWRCIEEAGFQPVAADLLALGVDFPTGELFLARAT